MSLKNVFIVSLTTSSSRFQDQRLLLLPIWQQHNSAWISHQVAKAQYSTRGLFTTGYVALHLWLFRSKAMSTELLHYKQTAEVLRRNARGKRQSFIVNINKNNKETQTTRPMVRKTEFMAPLCVCISIAQVNPNMLSCSISRPCSSVAQGYSVRSLLNQHICTLTMKIMCNHNFVCAPSESTLLTLTWRAWRDSIYFPLVILQCAWSPINIRTTEQAKGRCFPGRRCIVGHPFVPPSKCHTQRPTPAAWQSQSQSIHSWNSH